MRIKFIELNLQVFLSRYSVQSLGLSVILLPFLMQELIEQT